VAGDSAGVDQARVQFNAGAQAYSAGRYDAAVAAFEDAYRLAPRPQILFSLAQAERKNYFAGGKKEPQMLVHAVAHYEQYVKEVKEGARVPDAADALSELGPLAAKLDPAAATAPTAQASSTSARLTIYSPVEGAKISIDGGAAVDAPFIGEVAAGKHHVRVSAEGYGDAARDVVGEPGVRTTLDVPLEEKPAELVVDTERGCDVYVDGRVVGVAPSARPFPVPPGSHVVSLVSSGRRVDSREVTLVHGKKLVVKAELQRSGQRTASGVLLGVGAGSVAAGLVTGALSLAAESDAKKIRDASGNITGPDLDSYHSSVKQRDDFRTASIVTFSVGGAVLVSGVFLYFFDKPELTGAPPPKDKIEKKTNVDLALAPLVSPTVGGLILGGRF
jgi:hypothetical protein